MDDTYLAAPNYARSKLERKKNHPTHSFFTKFLYDSFAYNW